MNASRIDPYQYDSSSTAQMVRSNAWEAKTPPKNSGINETTNAESQSK